MKLLAIETSCDETAVAILEASGDESSASFSVLGNSLLSQIDLHRPYGGVFPALAKREHAKNLVPLLMSSLEEAGLLVEDAQIIPEETREKLSTLLVREPELAEAFLAALTEIERPDIDAIAVTAGPGLEPALWVGVNFARALSLVWNIPIVAVNHMEGHLLSALATRNEDGTLAIPKIELPLLGLLISGGHTEFVLMKEWLSYELIGMTRDDAVGEAFDKVARMMNLPYPGGPEIDRLAGHEREDTNPFVLPRPMLDAPNCDFSFSGLKTAVLYLIKERGELDDIQKQQMARAFVDAVCDVLWGKTSRALEETAAQTFVIGGGVAASSQIRAMFEKRIPESHPQVTLRIPSRELTTDNALMIGMAGYFCALRKEFADVETLRANGNLRVAD
jgi:N6-L-threonylcarbamoyladenine synthase